jgi:hypothetical protein
MRQSQTKSEEATKVRQNHNMTFCSEVFLAESRNCRKFEFWRFFIVKKKIERGASQLNRAGRSTHKVMALLDDDDI